MQRNLPRSITAQTGGHLTRYARGEDWTAYYRRRSGICCYYRGRRRRSGVTYCHCRLMAKTRDRILSSVLCGANIFEWGASGWPRASELPGWKRPRGEEQLLECLQSGEGFWVFRHVASSCGPRGSDADHYRYLSLFHLSEPAGEKQESRVVKASPMP